jgi:hypothetical protein
LTVSYLKNRNILIGRKLYIPSDLTFTFGTPIGIVHVKMTEKELTNHLSKEL